jgi:vancomycin resistance protein YoaR
MARVAAWFCFALLVLLTASGAVWLSSLGLPSGAAAPGVSIAGARLASNDVEAVVDELTRRVESAPISFSLGGEVLAGLTVTLGSIGVGVEREATLRRVRAIGRRGSPLERWHELEAARTHGVNVPLELTLDRDVFFHRLAALKQSRDQAPRPARFPSGRDSLVPHVPGRYLDLERAADEVWSLAQARAAHVGDPDSGAPALAVQLLEVSIMPRVNAEALQRFRPRQVISQYSTRFRVTGDQATRAANIGVAAARLDGLVLMPGDRFSFNDVVGERSMENGFFDSWELMDGEFVRGVGGGTCQVSSTLNAAALRAGLDIVEAYTHSRPLAYIEKGLDATVAWPFVDLKLKNSWPIPLAIQAVVSGNSVTVRVLAESSPGRVSMRSEVKETIPFPRVVEIGRVPRNSFKLKQPGIPGFRIERTRYIRPEGAEARREVVYKRYKPTPELFLVAPDFDLRELPPLVEGAEGYDPAFAPTEDGDTSPVGDGAPNGDALWKTFAPAKVAAPPKASARPSGMAAAKLPAAARAPAPPKGAGARLSGGASGLR